MLAKVARKIDNMNEIKAIDEIFEINRFSYTSKSTARVMVSPQKAPAK